MTEITSPHDRFFKGLFGRPEIARSFVQNYVPVEIVALMDLETLTLTGDSFVDVELQAQISDLVYQLRLRDGRRAYLRSNTFSNLSWAHTCRRSCGCFVICKIATQGYNIWKC